jgi:N-methylhydantoinase A
LTLLGIDTGGTFTDFVLWHGGRLRVHKVLSTPQAPERAVLQGIRELGLAPAGLRVIHGSTVATNAALEGKGVRTALVTNRGFADLLSIGRQNRAALYELQPAAAPPPVPRELCLETGGRLGADGAPVEPLTGRDLAELAAALRDLAPEAVAVNLLFSYLDDGAERRIAEIVPEGVFVSLSSQVLPEIREYERGVATWLNAWIGPRVAGYLRRLAAGLPGARVSVMQSSGETVAAEQAGDQAVRMLLSGPAGGLVGAQFVAAASGCRRLLSFDMGGTSTDVALLDGAPRLTSEGRIGRYPVAVPMVDMHTIGAGGGSIAWLDAGGMLQVGPASAGADPGPACYGRGGAAPTVTDANLVLGRLRADAFLGGEMPLDEAAARRALAPLARALGGDAEAAAQGIVDVANAHMARALRVISVERGIDPRGFVLVSFGGAGGLHVCALAEALGLDQALVPAHGGVLSALGMLAARPGRQLSHTRLGLLEELPVAELQAEFQALADAGRAALEREGVAAADCRVSRSVDLRYRGQSYTLNLPWSDPAGAAAAFHQRHDERYGHRLALPVELVNLRVAVTGPQPVLSLADLAPGTAAAPVAHCAVVGCAAPVPRYERAQLAPEQVLQGPAVLSERVATTWLAPGWLARVDRVGNLRLERLSAVR